MECVLLLCKLLNLMSMFVSRLTGVKALQEPPRSVTVSANILYWLINNRVIQYKYSYCITYCSSCTLAVYTSIVLYGYQYYQSVPFQGPDFFDFQQKIKDSIHELGGKVYPKLNWSSPKVIISVELRWLNILNGEVHYLFQSVQYYWYITLIILLVYHFSDHV